MSRVFIDDDLLSWEAYASGGKWGLPERAKIVFNCLSDPNRPARQLITEAGSVGTEQSINGVQEDRLREMLRESVEL